MAALGARGAVVVGISGDTAETHRLFKQVHALNFPLLADPEGKVARQFGMPLRKGGSTPGTNAQGRPLLDAKGQKMQVWRGTATAS